MDHEEAVRSQAVEKYLLGTLGETGADFEEHFFECGICAEEIKFGVMLADNAAAEFLGQAVTPVQVAKSKQQKETSSWKDWFRFEWRQAGFVMPALALLAVSGLWLRDHRSLQGELAQLSEPQLISSVPLDVARGAHTASVSGDSRYFAVSFYIDSHSYQNYLIEIGGNGLKSATVIAPAQAQGKSYNLLLPKARYPHGRYTFLVKGGPGSDGNLVEQFSLDLE